MEKAQTRATKIMKGLEYFDVRKDSTFGTFLTWEKMIKGKHDGQPDPTQLPIW